MCGPRLAYAFQELSRVYKFQKHTTEGVAKEYVTYHEERSKRILTNWRDIDRAKGAVDLIAVTTLTSPLAGFDPLLIFGPMVVGAGAEGTAKWAGYDDVFASGVGNLEAIGSSFFMPSVRSLGLAPSPSKISSYLAAERTARWEQNAAKLEANGLEWELSRGIQVGEGVTLFKRPPAQALSARCRSRRATAGCSGSAACRKRGRFAAAGPCRRPGECRGCPRCSRHRLFSGSRRRGDRKLRGDGGAKHA